MRIGLMADTHDNLDAIRYLIAYFHQQQINTVLHAGDFISPFTIPELGRFEGRVIGVFGNNDGDRETLEQKAEQTPVEIHNAPFQFDLESNRFLISHRPEDLPDPLPGDVDVVVHGHTHERREARTPEYMILNPGEAGGWLTGVTHAMVLDTNSMDVTSHVAPAP